MALKAPLELTLSAQPQAVPAVRRAVREQLLEWGLVDLIDEACLVVSELATNAVLHACGTLRVTLRRDGSGARLEVGDDSSRLPTQRQPTAMAGTGRGLALVAALTQDWGVQTNDAGGKVVWAVFIRPDGNAL